MLSWGIIKMANYERYRPRIRETLEKADRIIYCAGKHVAATAKFVKGIEDDLLIAEAESILRKASR